MKLLEREPLLLLSRLSPLPRSLSPQSGDRSEAISEEYEFCCCAGIPTEIARRLDHGKLGWGQHPIPEQKITCGAGKHTGTGRVSLDSPQTQGSVRLIRSHHHRGENSKHP